MAAIRLYLYQRFKETHTGKLKIIVGVWLGSPQKYDILDVDTESATCVTKDVIMDAFNKKLIEWIR